jgi:hypothetical protein
MPSPTMIRHYKRGNRVGLVIDVGGEFYFQVYDTGSGRSHNGETQLIYSHPYGSFETDNGRMGAKDHFEMWRDVGSF